MTLEDMALTLATNRKQLKQRLMEAKSVLVDKIRKGFGQGTFHFEERQLVGDNGYILQWRVRMHPDQAITYENQQTSRGCVVCLSPPRTPQQPLRRTA